MAGMDSTTGGAHGRNRAQKVSLQGVISGHREHHFTALPMALDAASWSAKVSATLERAKRSVFEAKPGRT